VSEIFVRIGMAFLSGSILGFERESHGRAAGLRTTVLVCVAAATAGILSDRFYISSFTSEFSSANWHPDPARLGAGLLTGIGFLGAGVIIRHGNLVRGVTTASQIWFVTIIGLCYGGGQLLLGFAGLVVSFVTVFCLHYVEEAFVKPDWYAVLTVRFSLPGASLAEVSDILHKAEIKINNLELAHDMVEKTRTAAFSVRFKRRHLTQLPEEIIASILALPGVLRVDWK